MALAGVSLLGAACTISPVMERARPAGSFCPDEALRRDQVGIVFQAFRLIPSMTALQNVAVPMELAGRRDADEMAATALEAVGLGHRKTHLPDQMSGGEQQRVAIARAIATRPRILLADEPTGNLDSGTSEKIIGRALRARRDEYVLATKSLHWSDKGLPVTEVRERVETSIHRV